MGDGFVTCVDPDQLMQHTVLQAHALLNMGMVTRPAPAVVVGQKRTSDGVVNGPAKRFKKKQINGSGFKKNNKSATAKTN